MTFDEHQKAFRARCRQDPRSNRTLLEQAESTRHDPDDPQYWDAVSTLHGRYDEGIHQAALPWTHHHEPQMRCVAADILGQAHKFAPEREAEIGRLLVDLLQQESEPKVTASLVFALGHNGCGERNAVLLPLVRHSDANVRYALAHSLSDYEPSPEVVAALFELSRDEDSDVRDWATFALGSQTDLDTPEIREALWMRVRDTDSDTQGEAVIGLARRKDPRVVPLIAKLLGAAGVCHHVIEAAEVFPHAEFVSLLERLDVPDSGEWLQRQLVCSLLACRTVASPT